ncbi:MAG: DNA polymerase III subunit beta [Muribaculaceae bacterium]
MRFKIPSKILLSHLTSVSKVVNSKNAISILDNFLFTLSGNKVVITGSDQETTLTTSVEVFDAEGEGKFAVNVKYLLDSLKELPDQGLTFEINDDNYEINIYYLNGKFNFIGINGNEFPEKRKSEEGVITLTIPAEEISKGIDQTIFAVGTEDLRPIMMGILWDIKPEEITFVASDTHKLVRYCNNRITSGIDASFILPTKPASILRAILPKVDGDVKITIEATNATFELKNYTLNCRFVNGKYPNYNSVIPQNNPYSLTVDRVSLLNAVRRVSVFASVGGLVKFEVRENEILLKAQDVDFSTWAEETVACEYSGEGMLIGFNNTRVIEVLNNLDGDTIILKLSDPSRAGIFVPLEQAKEEDLLILLMPMML